MPRLRTYSSISIEKYITLGFLSLILTGTLLLWLFNFCSETPISILDSLFLATSAVCVTGLSPLDISSALPLPSQLTLITLVQLGGIGIMAATTSLMLVIGRRLHFKERLFLAGGLGIDTPQGAVRLLRLLLFFTFASEALGASALFFYFMFEGMPLLTALYSAVFHSVSAFCNAGFSLFPSNYESYATSIVLPGVTMMLIITGGIGFPVIMELFDYKAGRRNFLSPYVKMVLVSTAALIAFGALMITMSEWDTAFAELPPWARIWNGLFASVTARTAGFDTVSYGTFSTGGLVITILLMAIGASPSSTGGGLKTTTFTVLLWSAWTELRQEDEVTIFGRQIGTSTIRRALAMAFIYFFTLFFASALLSALEEHPFPSLVFEAVSALGTTGLSRGITSELTNMGKMVIILLMYFGRVGLLTFSYSVVPHGKYANIHLPEAHIPIG